ncbi:single-stranded DNA-binding protein [[Mycoplasma] mobile]|nr:single-stranded DNA-binding protein [[Mycoplasma] mobile]
MNKVLLVGRIAQKGELKETSNSNIPYVRFRVAVRKDNVSQNAREDSDFIPVIAWRNTATFVNNYMNIGDLVSVEGTFSTSTFKNSNDEFVNVYEVTISNIKSLESKKARDERKEFQGTNNFETKQKSNSNFSEPTFVDSSENKSSKIQKTSQSFKTETDEDEEMDWDLEF